MASFKARDISTGNTELFDTDHVSSMTYETGQLHFTSGKSINVGTPVVTQIWNLINSPAPSPFPPALPPAPVATTNG